MGSSNNVTIGPIPDAQNDGVSIAAINANITSQATIIAPVAGKRIFVHGMFLTMSAAVPLTVQDVSAGATVNLTGPISLGVGTPLPLQWQNYPWFSCAAGDALVFALPSGSVAQVSGRILYLQG